MNETIFLLLIIACSILELILLCGALLFYWRLRRSEKLLKNLPHNRQKKSLAPSGKARAW